MHDIVGFCRGLRLSTRRIAPLVRAMRQALALANWNRNRPDVKAKSALSSGK